MRPVLCFVLLLGSVTAAAGDACLHDAIAAVEGAHPATAPLVLSTRTGTGEATTRVIGPTRPGVPLPDAHAGFRTASITKSFVAAAVLRLHEEGRLALDQPIATWLPPRWRRLLEDEGYAPARITPRQLLSHTAGLADHTRASAFLQAVRDERGGGWTRDRALQSLVDWTSPVAEPGAVYAYSDTGYLLLGALVEHATGLPLAQAVRGLLDYEAIGLSNTWWEQQEPDLGRERAHQWFDAIDTHDWNPSMDLYGGGGLVQDTADMARFFEALLQGRVFRDPATLALMRSREDLPAGTPYALGLLHHRFEGVDAIGHSGFWGTLALHAPQSGRSIAGATVDRADYPRLQAIVAEYLQRSATPERAARCGTAPLDGATAH